MSSPEKGSPWNPRRIVEATVFLLFLAGVQVLLPLSRLPTDRAVRFGWHMYAHGPEPVVFYVLGPDGDETRFTEGGFFARNRPEIRAERWIPEVLCRKIPEALRIRIEIRDREVGSHRCE
ncbi:MAG: hypothetical protein R3234_12400 [Thermoanaerobaculia bacterium]|nr:hypothetical protein [Thermoanaerobaculia bacterium]